MWLIYLQLVFGLLGTVQLISIWLWIQVRSDWDAWKMGKLNIAITCMTLANMMPVVLKTSQITFNRLRDCTGSKYTMSPFTELYKTGLQQKDSFNYWLICQGWSWSVDQSVRKLADTGKKGLQIWTHFSTVNSSELFCILKLSPTKD